MNHNNNILKQPVEYIKGIGESRGRLFRKLNIYSVEDLITYYPRDYEDWSNIRKLDKLVDGEACSFEGVVSSPVIESRLRKGLSIYKVLVKDDTGVITCTWFNQRFVKNALKTGEKLFFFGNIKRKFGKIEAQNPVYKKIKNGNIEDICRIVPIYPLTAGLSQNVLRKAISNALELLEGSMEEILPEWVRTSLKLSEINYCLRNIHFPRSWDDLNNARHRLVFEELLILQLGLLSIKNSLSYENSGIKFKRCPEIREFIKSLPFTLTNAQKKVFAEIEEDMESSKTMNRLVQGDVGSGKTVVAVLALLKAVISGYQGTLMVPTEILAEQHYATITQLTDGQFIDGQAVKTILLTGSQTKKHRQSILERIESGEIDIVIGTHALIEENVVFKKLGLVVTDEQHRFGVRQRAALYQKGCNPDVLVMTATPIPRTLALILYGDLDISIIDQLPPGRRPVKTYAVDASMRQRINNFIRKEVNEGRQVYIVCPLVEDSDTIDAKSALDTAESIAKNDFKDLRVGLVHGRMKPKEKESVMSDFVKGNIDILVSTTVIEVGVNVPNASIMVVENAERFGLAQLHQLRGRVGRGGYQSYCILYNESKSDISKERMKIMQETNDGFIISEKDLRLRGPGEFFGTRQHGVPDLKISNLYRDIDILKTVQRIASEILSRDKYLLQEENKGLKKMITEKFEKKLKELSLN
ncbi:MAG: ATP-dependent DNA helicase RecG [Acetivibrionales bacterium]